MTTEPEQPVTIEPPTDTPETQTNNEPRTRLSFKQTHALVTLCEKMPAQEHETFVDLAASLSEQLGFRVTTYSLNMGLEAAGRCRDTILKPVVKEVDLESLTVRVTEAESQIGKLISVAEGTQKQIALLEGIINKILNQTVANEVA